MLSSPCLDSPAQGQVAAAEIADNRVEWVGAVHQVKFRVERMPEEEFDFDLFSLS